MENVSIRLQTATISRLKLTEFFRLRFAWISRVIVVNEEIPDFLTTVPCVERFELRVANPAILLVWYWRLGAIATADQLHDALAFLDLLAQHSAQIAPFRPD